MPKDSMVIKPIDNQYDSFSIRIPTSLTKQLNDISAQTGYSRNKIIIKLLEFAVERYETPNE